MTTATLPTPTALRPEGAAAYTGLTTASLANHRFRGTGPKFVKRGRLIFYPVVELDRWMTGNRRRS